MELEQEPTGDGAGAASSAAFRARLEDADAPVALELDSPSRCALVAFGGIVGALGMPPFEFFKVTDGLECKKIFLRDLHQAWYHGGLPGICNDIGGIAEFLRARLAGAGVERLVLVGNSMGGYAALLLGVMLKADVVLAFSPQTYIDERTRRRTWDRRWTPEVERAQELGHAVHDWFDLRPMLHGAPSSLRAQVHFSLASRLDSVHALRLLRVPAVELHPHVRGGHNAIQGLRESGALRAILAEALRGPALAAQPPA
jgi:pimeloyl-ACP methyl ester carboxylesterase